MQKSCRQCKSQFEITANDLKFYEKVSPVFAGKKYLVPPPTLCPDCRQQRRMAFMNIRKLYHRKCDFTGKEIISVYSPEKSYKVYDQKIWWGNQWSATEYGRDFDFTKTFFQQFNDLLKVVPRPSLLTSECENCDYSNFSANNKNSYLIFQSSHNEECYYSSWIQKCFKSMDVYFCHQSQYCYESCDLESCYRCFYSRSSQNCRDSYFLLNCRACEDCFGCINLSHKKYCIFNEQKTKAEYEQFMKSMDLSKHSNVKKTEEMVNKFFLTQPHKFAELESTENCSGNYLKRGKNCEIVFDGYDLEDCKYCENAIRNAKDCMDVTNAVRNSELLYESVQAVIGMYHCIFCTFCRQNSSSLIYSDLCITSKNCFGSIGLRNKQYCILNQQYTKDEYEMLVPKIIEHMSKTGEFGEFYPIDLSTFCYNETIANYYYPTSKENIIALGGKWKNEDQSNFYQGAKFEIPDDIKEVEDNITKKILCCEKCKRNYRLVEQELTYYREINLPVPRNCTDCRHDARLSLRNPRHLWPRTCSKCSTPIQTSYSPNRPEIVYCESCYLKEIY